MEQFNHLITNCIHNTHSETSSSGAAAAAAEAPVGGGSRVGTEVADLAGVEAGEALLVGEPWNTTISQSEDRDGLTNNRHWPIKSLRVNCSEMSQPEN